MQTDGRQPDELDELLARLFDPGLTREQATMLRRRLRESRTQRRRYIKYVTLHSMLESELALQDERLLADLGEWMQSPEKNLSDAWVLPAIRQGESPEEFSQSQEPAMPGSETGRQFETELRPQAAATLIRWGRTGTWMRQNWLVKAAICLLAIGLAMVVVMRWMTTRPLATVEAVADARWGETAQGPIPGATLTAARQLVLEGGCVKLRLTGGAQVILEAPAVFQLESGSTISLSSGRLSATVPGGGFTVQTPSATFVDLGTKFGVEARDSGGAHVEVFEGNVRAQPMSGSAPSGTAQVISAGQAADVSAQAVAVDPAGASPQRFVLDLGNLATPLDVTDLLCGGDGTTARRGDAIDPRSGQSGVLAQIGHFVGDHQYHRVPLLPVVDGCFVPDGASGATQIDSASDTFVFPAAVNGSSQLIWAGGAIGSPPIGDITMKSTLAGINYGQPGHGFLAMHCDKGLTFDLNAVRRLHPGSRLARFQSVVGDTGVGPNQVRRTTVLILVDGKLRFANRAFWPGAGAFDVNVQLEETDRFLTLVTLEAGDGIAFNWVLFGDPIITLAKK
jgi:hypothetical protein